jgi:hypothetical protein
VKQVDLLPPDLTQLIIAEAGVQIQGEGRVHLRRAQFLGTSAPEVGCMITEPLCTRQR